jgi:hypothetical protein
MGLVLGLIMLAASSGLLGAIFQMLSLFGGYLWVVVFRGAGLLLRGFAWIWFWAVCFEGRLSYLDRARQIAWREVSRTGRSKVGYMGVEGMGERFGSSL